MDPTAKKYIFVVDHKITSTNRKSDLEEYKDSMPKIEEKTEHASLRALKQLETLVNDREFSDIEAEDATKAANKIVKNLRERLLFDS